MKSGEKKKKKEKITALDKGSGLVISTPFGTSP